MPEFEVELDVNGTELTSSYKLDAPSCDMNDLAAKCVSVLEDMISEVLHIDLYLADVDESEPRRRGRSYVYKPEVKLGRMVITVQSRSRPTDQEVEDILDQINGQLSDGVGENGISFHNDGPWLWIDSVSVHQPRRERPNAQTVKSLTAPWPVGASVVRTHRARLNAAVTGLRGFAAAFQGGLRGFQALTPNTPLTLAYLAKVMRHELAPLLGMPDHAVISHWNNDTQRLTASQRRSLKGGISIQRAMAALDAILKGGQLRLKQLCDNDRKLSWSSIQGVLFDPLTASHKCASMWIYLVDSQLPLPQ